MKNTYTAPIIEIVELANNDVLLFSQFAESGSLDTIIFGDMFK